MKTRTILSVVLTLVIAQIAFAGRYYDARTARWTTPDPALRDGNPQEQIKKYGHKLFEMSPYNYSFNNPLRYIDQDGKWPTKTHNLIIDRAFGSMVQAGQMSPRNLAMIKVGSRQADNDQSTFGSFKHAMNGPGDLSEGTKTNMSNFVESKLGEFIGNLNSDPDKAFTALGEALHPLMDATSPAHSGFQLWEGTDGSTGAGSYNLAKVFKAYGHASRESGYDDSDPEVQKAIRILQQIYNATMQGNSEAIRQSITDVQ